MSNLKDKTELPWLDEVSQRHATGVEFKLHPHRTDLLRTTLQYCLGEIRAVALQVWLWLEKRRLGCDFASAAGYALSRINQWPDTGRWRNSVANAKVFGLRALLRPRHLRYLRERVLNALTPLLWVDGGNSHESSHHVRRELISPEPTEIFLHTANDGDGRAELPST